MALTAAIGVGVAAAVAVPTLILDEPGLSAGPLAHGLVALPIPAGGLHLFWSWPVFAIVTLIAWGLLAAARDR